jgi:transcriptional antiterminator RfaH
MMAYQGCSALTWYVIATWPKAEERASKGLERLGCRCYVPMISCWRRFRHKRVEDQRPLFPRYLFAGFTDPPSWLAVYDLPGVEAALGVRGEPKSISAQIVSDLQAAQIAGVFDPREEEQPRIDVGAEVKVMRGPFEGLGGQCMGLSAAGRADVLMQMLNSERLVKIPVDQLALVAR